jgi:hypothetical protein
MVLFFNRVRLRYRTGAPILFAVAALLAGCAGAGQASPGSADGIGPASNVRSGTAAVMPRLQTIPAAYPALSADTASTLYASDSLANTVTEYDTSTGAVIRTLGGGSSGHLYYPEGMFVSKGALYVADYGGSGNAVLIFKSGATLPSKTLLEGSGFDPTDVAVGTDGTVYVSNYEITYSASGNVEVFAKGHTTAKYSIPFPGNNDPVLSLALDSSNNLYVGWRNSKGAGEISEYAPGSTKGVSTGFVVGVPNGMTFDKSGDLVVVDNNVVDVFQAGTVKPIRQFGSLTQGGFAAFTKSGTYLYVADTGANEVDEFHYSTGKLLTTIPLSDAAGVALSPPEAL